MTIWDVHKLIIKSIKINYLLNSNSLWWHIYMSENTKKCVYQSRVFYVNLYNVLKILLNNSRFHIDLVTLFKWEQHYKNCSQKYWLMFSTSGLMGTKNHVKKWPYYDPSMTLRQCSPIVPIITKIENKLPQSCEQYYSMKTNLRSKEKESKQTLLFSLFDIHKEVFFSIAYNPPLNH